MAEGPPASVAGLLFLGGAVVGALSAHFWRAARMDPQRDESTVVAIGRFDKEGDAGVLRLASALSTLSRRQLVLVHDDFSCRLISGQSPHLPEATRAASAAEALPGAEVRVLPAGGFGVRRQLLEEIARSATGRVFIVVSAVVAAGDVGGPSAA
jgi:hypothetical protein